MQRNLLKISLSLFFLIALFLTEGQLSKTNADGHAVIHLDQTTHAFSPVFEGEELSHTFKVFNRGEVNLDIKRVTPS